MNQFHKSTHRSHLQKVAGGAVLALLITVKPAYAQVSDSGVTVFEAPFTGQGESKFYNDDDFVEDAANGKFKEHFKKSPYEVIVKKDDSTDAKPLDPYVFCMQLKDQYNDGQDLHSSNQRYYKSNWKCSHSYVNFQTTGAVLVEVRKTDKSAFGSMTEVYPKRYLKRQSDGSYFKLNQDQTVLEFTMTESSNVVVDVDGQLMSKVSEQTPTHPISIHATDVIDPPKSGTFIDVLPGKKPTPTSEPVTYWFRKGVHKLGSNFKIHANQKFYIPGDAVVYGTFNNKDDNTLDDNLGDAIGIEFYGHGTITGNNLNHWEMEKVNVPSRSGPYHYTKGSETVTKSDKDGKKADGSDGPSAKYKEQQRISYKKNTIEFSQCLKTRVEGLVILNPANHALSLFTAKREMDQANRVKHLKIIGFRTNSDGAGINDSSIVEKCFYRVQDDGFYPKGIALKNNVLWSDAHGACLRMDALKDAWQPFTVENIDIVFRRNTSWSDSGAIEMPKNTNNKHTKKVTFQNINIYDTNNTKPMINLQLQDGGELANVTFKNVTIASDKVKNIIKAKGTGIIHNITFDNLKIKGVIVTEENYRNYFDYERIQGDNIKFIGGDSKDAG